MRTKKIIWTRSGFEIPGVGITKEGETSRLLPKAQANELIERGLAEEIPVKTPKTDIKKGDKA